ncbi:TetR family transcriptional regulator [Streptomyces fumigatiscleroticus]|nr:TetR family transcriptional regulator [Streptomyces fumigatiscleroticus]
MEIARAAAGLFVRHGLRAARAEDIAQAAGVAPRTFYRYFACKEEAIAPLYAEGARSWAEAVRDAPAGLSLPQALEHAVRYTLTPGAGMSASSWERIRTLIRLAEGSPALGKVWAEECRVAERMLAGVLAGRAARGDDDVAAELAASPRLCFAAATASAAVRVAVERWACGDAPPEGPQGPTALAMRNLEVLRTFPWDELTGATGRHGRTRPPGSAASPAPVRTG